MRDRIRYCDPCKKLDHAPPLRKCSECRVLFRKSHYLANRGKLLIKQDLWRKRNPQRHRAICRRSMRRKDPKRTLEALVKLRKHKSYLRIQSKKIAGHQIRARLGRDYWHFKQDRLKWIWRSNQPQDSFTVYEIMCSFIEHRMRKKQEK